MEFGADPYMCTCDTDVCLRHFTGIPFSAEDNFLTGKVSFIQDDRWPYIDQGSNHSFADYGYWTVSDSLELFPRSGATLATPYLANPDSRLDENPRSTYTVPGNATLAQLPNLSIVTNFPCNSLPPSLSSASTPRPSPTDLFPPTYLTAKHGMGIKPVGSHPMRMASNRRREKLPEFPCPFPECSADFTARHNLEYHMNAHLNLRPYKCAYSDFGCIYEASAPRTVKRHNQTCKYNPKNN